MAALFASSGHKPRAYYPYESRLRQREFVCLVVHSCGARLLRAPRSRPWPPSGRPALAQTAAPAAPAAVADTSSTDVIVTAEHRQTRLQKIPVAVSVFTGASRDRAGISTVQDVTNFAPGFVYDPANVHAYIRGVGRQSINVTNDSRVTAYEDEFFVYSPYQLAKSSLFLSQEQIERGPQNVGGRNAAGGSIDMISVRPTSTPYAEVRGTVGNYGTYNVEAAASGPVAPGLNLRIDGYDHNQNQGYYKNVDGPGSEGNELHEWYIEGQADWKMSPNADLYVRGFASGWNDRGDAGAPHRLSDRPLGRNQPDRRQRLRRRRPVRESELRLCRSGARPAGRGRPQSGRSGAVQHHAGASGIFDNPALNNTGPSPKFAAILPRTVHLGGYNGIQANFTYHFPTFDFRNIVGEQGYNYSLNYSEPDTAVTSFTLPGSSGIPAPVPLAAPGFPAPSALVSIPLVDLRYQEYDHWGSDEFSIQSTTDSPLQYTAGVFPTTSSTPTRSAPRRRSRPISISRCWRCRRRFSTLGPAPPRPTRTAICSSRATSSTTTARRATSSSPTSSTTSSRSAATSATPTTTSTATKRAATSPSTIRSSTGSRRSSGPTPSLRRHRPRALTCPSGNPANCAAGPLAKGVRSIGVVNPDTGIIRRDIGDSSDALTGGAGIEFTPTPDIFMYARYGRGYEDFSFNAGYNSANPEVAPEFLNSYELGYKQSFGRKFSIDTAALLLRLRELPAADRRL